MAHISSFIGEKVRVTCAAVRHWLADRHDASLLLLSCVERAEGVAAHEARSRNANRLPAAIAGGFTRSSQPSEVRQRVRERPSSTYLRDEGGGFHCSVCKSRLIAVS